MTHPLRSLAAAAAAAGCLAACGLTTPAKPGAGTTSCGPSRVRGATLSCTFTETLPNTLLTPPGATAALGYACPPGSMIVSGARVAGTANITLGDVDPTTGLPEDEPAKIRTRTSIPDGTGAFVIAPVSPTDRTCATTVTPTTSVTLAWAGTHVARVDRAATPNCVFQSRMTFRSFTMTGLGALGTPRPVDATLRDSVLLRMDNLVADRIDFITRGSAHTAGTGTRCAGWRALPAGA